MKNETIYRRKGWTDKTFEGIAMGDGTVSLLNESGEVVVSGLEFIANPEDVTADDLPGSFATGKSPGKSKAAPPVVDLEKAAAVVAKIRDQAESDPFLPGDLNKVNVPTLLQIAGDLELEGIESDAKSGDLKEAIEGYAEASKPIDLDGALDTEAE